MVLGHEAVATVQEVGNGVAEIQPGDRVVLAFVPSCGTCAVCQSGRPALCEKAAASNAEGSLLHGGPVLRDRSGAVLLHHLGVSAFAEEAIVARESAVVVPHDVPIEVLAVFGCAVLTGMGAVLNTAAVRPGQSVAVYGVGGVGIAALMAARLVGAYPIIAVDPISEKHILAKRIGATAAVTPSEARMRIAELTPNGVDVVIEAVGRADVLAECVGVSARGGTTVAVGLPNAQSALDVPALAFAAGGRRILGSYMGDAVPARDIPTYLALWRAGHLPFELMHSSTLGLEKINSALDALADATVVRQLVIP
jgi:alcohol dehydrogenase